MDKNLRSVAMNVNLTPELERLVQEKVASGLYNNQSEVVREALRLLVGQDRLREAHLARLRGALADGVDEADTGDLLDGGSAMEELRDFLRSRRAPPSQGEWSPPIG
jgi:antitoxin ParD1/3/4